MLEIAVGADSPFPSFPLVLSPSLSLALSPLLSLSLSKTLVRVSP